MSLVRVRYLEHKIRILNDSPRKIGTGASPVKAHVGEGAHDGPGGSVEIVIVGVPAERKPGENRVALTPDGARDLATHGHRVLVETGAGEGSAITDDDFATAGAELVTTAEAWGAELVIKVKEPQDEEYGLLRRDLVSYPVG